MHHPVTQPAAGLCQTAAGLASHLATRAACGFARQALNCTSLVQSIFASLRLLQPRETGAPSGQRQGRWRGSYRGVLAQGDPWHVRGQRTALQAARGHDGWLWRWWGCRAFQRGREHPVLCRQALNLKQELRVARGSFPGCSLSRSPQPPFRVVPSLQSRQGCDQAGCWGEARGTTRAATPAQRQTLGLNGTRTAVTLMSPGEGHFDEV